MKQALFAYSLLAWSCCDSGAPAAPSHFQLESKYYLHAVAISDLPTRIDHNSRECANDGSLSICVASDPGAIWVEARNDSSAPETIDWHRTVWIDERGNRSAVDVAPVSMAAWPPDLAFQPEPAQLDPSESLRVLIWPRGKTYYVHESCRNVALFQEPLIPRHLSGNPQTDEAVADAMYAERRQVALLIPVTGRESRDIRISFMLATPDDLVRQAR